MSEREELEAEIKAIEEAWLFAEDTGDMAARRRHLATALLSSGYTKGNGGTGLTDEEKALAFIGDLSDESAGRVLKFVERAFVEAMADKGDALDKIDGHEAAVSSTTAAALFLVRHALAVSATSLEIDLGGADIDGEEVGDWVIQIHKGPLPDKGNGELVEAVRHLVALIDDREACRTGSNGDQILQAESRLRAALSALPNDEPNVDVNQLIDAGRDVLDERERQKAVEGWTPEHDDEYDADELAGAAICYAATPAQQEFFEHFDGADLIGTMWPVGWDFRWFKPKDRRRDLVRAGALIIAEIERLDRAAARNASEDTQRSDSEATPTQGDSHE